MLLYFLRRGVGEVCTNFKLNRDAALTDWHSLLNSWKVIDRLPMLGLVCLTAPLKG